MGSHKITIMQVKVILLCFHCSLAKGEKIHPGKERAGGLLGFGILGGDSADSTTGAPADASDATAATNEDLAGPMKALIDLLTGVTDKLPISDIAALMGINTDPIPSPFSDPLGFVTHPLITPIIMAAVTLNIPAMALAQGALAGNLLITHLLTSQAQG